MATSVIFGGPACLRAEAFDDQLGVSDTGDRAEPDHHLTGPVELDVIGAHQVG
ncbi:hypothetical protein [Nocardia niigatensis]